MPLLKFDEEKKSNKSNKRTKIVLAIFGLVIVSIIGSTFASSISINSGAAIEFGQGVEQAVACDTDGITVTPTSTFTNSQNAGSFYVSTIAVTGIATGCNGKVFTVKLYGDSSSTALTVAATAASSATPTTAGQSSTVTTTALKVKFSTGGTYASGTARTDATWPEPYVDYTLSGTSTSFTVTLGTSLAASGVYKITVETA